MNIPTNPDGGKGRAAKKAERTETDCRENGPVETLRIAVIHRGDAMVRIVRTKDRAAASRN